jgi:hypothetical protein
MKFLQKIKPVFVLRLSLGLSYLYSGYDLFVHPTGWYWALRPLPDFAQEIINDVIGKDLFLKTQGVGEMLMAVLFLAWFLPKFLVRIAALLSAAQMAMILTFVGLTLETFRDIPLLGASLAVFLMSFKKHGAKSRET